MLSERNVNLHNTDTTEKQQNLIGYSRQKYHNLECIATLTMKLPQYVSS